MSVLRHEVTMAAAPVRPGLRIGSDTRVFITGGSAEHRSEIQSAFRHVGAEVVGGASDEPTLIVDAGLWGLDTRDWRPAFRRSVEVLRTVEPVWSQETRMGRYTYVALVGGAHQPPEAEQGIWSGLAKTVPREFPAVTARVVQLSSESSAPGALVLEALSATDAIEVAHDGATISTPLAVTHSAVGSSKKLSADDVVLLTGGARGIGFALAEKLASHGCRVIVSGREHLRRLLSEEWATATDAEFRGLKDSALIHANRASIASVRRTFERRARLREVMANLDRAAEAGLAIEYVQCDVQDADSVAALVHAAGKRLRIVLHNAGIDTPRRLRQKSTDSMEEVISVKLDGFRNVRAAIEGSGVEVLALTGSLTGRYGGMRGQLDYAAANESLAFAAKAEATSDLRVVCTSWPTWDGVGLISNMRAAAQYMEPISVEEGVDAWIAEIQGDSRGEVAFMGDFAAVSAQHLVGVPIPSNWAGARKMLERRQFLGDVEVYEPDSRIVSRHELPVETTPWFASASVDGRPAVPVSAVLEYLVRAKDGYILDLGDPWSVNDLQIDLTAAHADSGIVMRRTAQLIDENSLTVTLTRVDLEKEVEFARAIVRFAPRDSADVLAPHFSPDGADGRKGQASYQWPGGHALAFHATSTAHPMAPNADANQIPSTLLARDIERVLASRYDDTGFPHLLAFREIRLRAHPPHRDVLRMRGTDK